MNSSTVNGLIRYSRTPAAMACRSWSRSLSEDMIMQTVFGLTFATLRIAVNPSMRGMLMSKMARSGWSLCASSSASTPSRATATISSSRSSESIMRTLLRNSAVSSAMRIRMVGPNKAVGTLSIRHNNADHAKGLAVVKSQ